MEFHRQQYIPNNSPNLSDADYYMNINIRNNKDYYIPAITSDVQVNDILNYPERFKVGVLRLDLPVLEVPIQEYVDNYYITMKYPDTGAVITQMVPFIDLNLSPTIPPFNQQNIWRSWQLIDMFNLCLSNLFTAISATAGYNTLGNAPTSAPYFTFDENSQLMSLITPYEYRDSNSERVEIWINLALIDILSGFNSEFDPSVVSPTGPRIRFIITDYNNNYIVNPKTLPPPALPVFPTNYVFKLTQDGSSVSNWYDFYKIYLVASGMPFRGEGISGLIDQNGSTKDVKIIADFSYTFSRLDYSRITGSVSGEIFWTDILSSTDGLSNLNFQIKYLTKQDQIKQVYLGPGDHCNIKLLFRKK